MFYREKIAKTASDIAEHLKVIENIKALQVAQKEMMDSIQLLSDRIRELQADMRSLKAEVTLEAVKETQLIVNAVQGGLNQRMETLAIKVAMVEKGILDSQIQDRSLPAHSVLPFRSSGSD